MATTKFKDIEYQRFFSLNNKFYKKINDLMAIPLFNDEIENGEFFNTADYQNENGKTNFVQCGFHYIIMKEDDTVVSIAPEIIEKLIHDKDLEQRATKTFSNLNINDSFYSNIDGINSDFYKKIGRNRMYPYKIDENIKEKNFKLEVKISSSLLDKEHNYIKVNEKVLYNPSHSWNITIFDEDYNYIETQEFDTLNNKNNDLIRMKFFLQEILDNSLVIIQTSDEPRSNFKDDTELMSILRQFGVNQTIFENVRYNNTYLFLCRKNKEKLAEIIKAPFNYLEKDYENYKERYILLTYEDIIYPEGFLSQRYLIGINGNMETKVRTEYEINMKLIKKIEESEINYITDENKWRFFN